VLSIRVRVPALGLGSAVPLARVQAGVVDGLGVRVGLLFGEGLGGGGPAAEEAADRVADRGADGDAAVSHIKVS
jgi:hypothetical protein